LEINRKQLLILRIFVAAVYVSIIHNLEKQALMTSSSIAATESTVQLHALGIEHFISIIIIIIYYQ
jgi:hypothetical protein